MTNRFAESIKTKSVTVRLTSHDVKTLDRIAKEMGIKRSEAVRIAVRDLAYKMKKD